MANSNTQDSRVRPLRLPKPPSTTRSSVPDWLGKLIEVARLATSAGDLAPFPYIKGAAGAVVVLLETIEVRLITLKLNCA
jgi:hypothetical protein